MEQIKIKKNKYKFFIPTIIIGVFLFSISKSEQAYAYSSNNKSEEVLIDKSNFSTKKGIPDLASTSLNYFNEQFPIKIEEDSQLNEAAIASRSYEIYSQTDECIISVNFNFNFYLGNAFRQIKLEQLKTFVYLHEIAHCADGEPEPEGVDKNEWLEALADGYAAGIMLQNDSMTINQFELMKNYRRTQSNNGAAKMDEYLIKNKPTTWKMLKEEDMLQQIKSIRRKIFQK
jgi:hypothetical protein